ncbi:MAG: hypothetical protein AAGI30_10070 [Planctomycetota bacterium]
MTDSPTPRPGIPTRDTSALRKVRPSTILWLGVLLGFMGLLAMAVAVAMTAAAMKRVQQSQAEVAGIRPHELRAPTLIRSDGRHDSLDGRFKLTVVLNAQGEVRYSITTTDAAARRVLDGGFDPALDTSPDAGPDAEPGDWFFCWDREDNLWVWSAAGYERLHAPQIEYQAVPDWTQDAVLRSAAPEPVLNELIGNTP